MIHRILKVADLIDQLSLFRISSREHAAVSKGTYFLQIEFSSGSNGLDKLYVHIIDETLKILSFIVGQGTRG